MGQCILILEYLLLDFHGQAASADTIFRGTQNGTTVMKMVEQHGAVALTGEQSILGYLATKGIKVSPANTPPGTPPETKSFGGGWIVRSYGSHTTNGADAMSDAAELRLPRWLNATFEAMLSIDLLLIRAGIDLKWGGSRLVVGKKT